jgi:hypothetical protein
MVAEPLQTQPGKVAQDQVSSSAQSCCHNAEVIVLINQLAPISKGLGSQPTVESTESVSVRPPTIGRELRMRKALGIGLDRLWLVTTLGVPQSLPVCITGASTGTITSLMCSTAWLVWVKSRGRTVHVEWISSTFFPRLFCGRIGT